MPHNTLSNGVEILMVNAVSALIISLDVTTILSILASITVIVFNATRIWTWYHDVYKPKRKAYDRARRIFEKHKRD